VRYCDDAPFDDQCYFFRNLVSASHSPLPLLRASIELTVTKRRPLPRTSLTRRSMSFDLPPYPLWRHGAPRQSALVAGVGRGAVTQIGIRVSRTHSIKPILGEGLTGTLESKTAEIQVILRLVATLSSESIEPNHHHDAIFTTQRCWKDRPIFSTGCTET
jgi:hypothetical protein